MTSDRDSSDERSDGDSSDDSSRERPDIETVEALGRSNSSELDSEETEAGSDSE